MLIESVGQWLFWQDFGVDLDRVQSNLSSRVVRRGVRTRVLPAVAYDDSYDDEYVYSQAILSEDINAYLGEMDITTPIFLQTNEEWADRSYGNDGSQTLAENGCAIDFSCDGSILP